tara:strand:+ start:5640 stop:7877 length:2238 start_codon:yes stop_codon:yes gene_type:complete
MFKYGSLRQFFIKIFIGALTVSFSLVYLGSLISYSENDPGFNTFSNNELSQNILNYFGILGSKISSYSIVIIGGLSYVVASFLLLEGLKSLFGVKNNRLLLRFLSNIAGVLFISVFIYLYGIDSFESGIVSIFISDLINNFLLNNLTNSVLIYLFYLIILIAGLALVIYSFSIKYKFIKRMLFFLKYLKFLRYLNFISPLRNIFKHKPSKKIIRSRNEPTIKRGVVFPKKENDSRQKKWPKQMEIDQFRFALPNKNLLKKSLTKNITNKELNRVNSELADKLEKTLSEYGVEGKVIGFKTGPIVTLFEFVPNAGIKSSKIIGLSEDIARAMSSISARISSQPGKTSLGIEIPNQKRDGVLFGDLIDDERFLSDENALTLALGKNISGEKVFTDLEKMPHLLIAGTTGSGKSVGINTMILSLLFKFKPNECKLILIDPKMLELSIYEDIPHLLTPVVTNPNKAVFALKWVVREMENRYKLMSSISVKNISSYNNKVLRTLSSGRKLFREVQTGIDNDTRMPILEKIEIKLEKMPFIVVVIDEMADLMMVAGKEVESLVQRLAQMARASGIHLITATQRPSVDVITGTIKANFPSRISYKVASKFDSRTILNEMGAEQLLGSGDMLLLENGANIKRLHGGFISEGEVEEVVNAIKKQATFDYKKEISLDEVNLNSTKGEDLISNNSDELYNKAVEIIIKQQKVSTSYIQRYLQIGYNRAARIIEKMEEDGIISEANNAGKRHVLKKE